MGDIFDTMVEFFQREEWTYDQIPDQPILRLGMSGKSGKWVGYAQAREEQDQFVFYSILPVTAPEAKRHTMAELLTRMNYGLVVGNWEMDYRDGEIRYKTSIDVEGDRLSTALVRNVVLLNLQMMDRSLPAIMGVLYGGTSIDVALQQIENYRNTPPS
ncbi:MAG TPA: YbjN domain-containing protein [Symbiobacteriaceae bacterium]|nr:YbjN domain-containing protein [Symbiobacteriaceae bacterium]